MPPPMISPRFRVIGVMLQYKPYPSYPNWLTAWDMTDLFISIAGSIAAEESRAIEQELQLASGIASTLAIAEAAQSAADTALTAATIAESQANIGIADAAVAYGFAETANIAVEDLQLVVNDLTARVTALENP